MLLLTISGHNVITKSLFVLVLCVMCNLWITHEYAAATAVRFSRYPSRDQGVIGRLIKFVGYIHNHKILPGNIFGLILKNKMSATGVL